FLMILLTPRSTLFPYTTLFRSETDASQEIPTNPSTQARLLRARHNQDRLCADNPTYVPELMSWHISIHPRYCPSIVAFDLHSSKDRKSTRLNSSHVKISYAVFC